MSEHALRRRSWWAPSSLRNKLLLWLVSLHLLAALSAGVAYYIGYGRMVQDFMDGQMEALASSYAANDDIPELPRLTHDSVHDKGAYVVQIWSSDSKLLASSMPEFALALQEGAGLRNVAQGPDRGDRWRVYTTPPGSTSKQLRVQIARTESFMRDQMADRAMSAAVPIVLLLPLSLAVLWLMVWLASRSLHAVAIDVSAQDERTLTEISIERVPTEIVPLVAAFNSLMRRLRDAFAAQRYFVQDAAHELRTPVAAIGLQLENLRADVPEGEATERFAQLESGVRRVRHLIEQLLHLSRQESPVQSSVQTDVDVAALVRESLNHLMVIADRRKIDVGFEADITTVVKASAIELRSIFDNLIANALHHAPVGGTVDVRMHKVGSGVAVDVVDNGPGIPPEFLARVFDRFFRVPGTAPAGSGLGLAIARAAAARHGLRIELMNRRNVEDGATGLVARVHLPP